MEILFAIILILLSPIIILLITDYYVHHNRRGRWVDKIPGPKFFPILGNSLDINIPLEKLWHFLRNSARDFYPVYKYWIVNWPIVNIHHPEDVGPLITSSKNIEKSMFYDLFHSWLKKGLLTSTGDKWRARRKLLNQAFHFNLLQEFVDIFVKRTDQLVEALKKEAESGEVVKELYILYTTLSINLICETSMRMHLDEKDETSQKYIKSIQDIGEIFMHRARRPWLKNSWIFDKTAKGKKQKKALEIIHGFSSKMIEERKKYHEKTGGKYLNALSEEDSESETGDVDNYRRLTFMDLLIATSRKALGIDDTGIQEEVDTFLFEGHDTTAMGLLFLSLLLAEYKDIQVKCREEVEQVMAEANGKLTIKEIQKLNYLDRCFKESLRLYPSVPTISRKITDDIQLKNCFLPKGTAVNINICDTHRDPNFWPHPNVFDPDRFLPERSVGRHPFAYVPFSAGPRNCIGQKYAMLEMKAVMAKLLSNFYLEPMELAANVRIIPDILLRNIDPVPLKFIPIVQ